MMQKTVVYIYRMEFVLRSKLTVVNFFGVQLVQLIGSRMHRRNAKAEHCQHTEVCGDTQQVFHVLFGAAAVGSFALTAVAPGLARR